MKLEQFIAKAVDQNEIESKYLWYCPTRRDSKTIYRHNLSTNVLDLSIELWDLPYIKHLQILPDNKIFWVKVNWSQSIFISDDNFNIKAIKQSNELDLFHIESISIASCFYEDSVFIFEHGIDLLRGFVEEAEGNFYWFKRYSLSQNKWISLATPPFYFIDSCTGYNQKILICEGDSGIWVYDVVLDSYSKFITNILWEKSSKILIKSAGKVYMINQSNSYWIYTCDGNLSDWTLLSKSNNSLRMNCYLKYFYYAYYKGSIYYLSESILFKFDLKKLRIQKLKNYKKFN